MRWLAVAAYLALVVVSWIHGGPATGIIFLVCVLFLLVSFRPNDVGSVVQAWARLLHRPTGARASSSG